MIGHDAHDEDPITEDELRNRFARWVRALRLGHWQFDIRLTEEPQVDTNEAEIVMSDDYDYGWITFKATWKDWSRKLLDEVIVHELVHAILHDLQVAALEGRDGYNKEAARLFTRRLTHELEKATDAITVTILANTEARCGTIE